MTAEHSAGTAVFSSLRQLATSASRSTVRTPLAAASAAALLASGERMESAGSELGSEAMFIASFYAPADGGSTGAEREATASGGADCPLPRNRLSGCIALRTD